MSDLEQYHLEELEEPDPAQVDAEWAEIERLSQLHQDAMLNATRALEAQHKKRDLHFNTSFIGNIPIEAYGFIDGMRFYFRYRNARATMRVGPRDDDQMMPATNYLESIIDEAGRLTSTQDAVRVFNHALEALAPV